MSPILLAVLAFVSVAALGVAFVPSLFGFGTDRAQQRRQAFKGDTQANRANAIAAQARDNRRKTVQDALKTQAEALEKRKKRIPLQMQLFQAGLSIKKSSYVRNCVIFGVGVFALLFVSAVPIWFAAIISVAVTYVGSSWFLGFRRKRYQAKYLDELPNAIEAIVRGIKAGMPLNDSIRIVANEVKEPVRSEFGRILEQQSIGKTISEAVMVLYDRVPLPDVNFFVVVIAVQQQSGGNLAEALSNLSMVLRNRKKMKAKVKAMSSEAKASAMIIGALPFVVGLLVSLVSPGYLSPLLETTLGHIWLAVGAFLYGLGGFIMNKMIQFDI